MSLFYMIVQLKDIHYFMETNKLSYNLVKIVTLPFKGTFLNINNYYYSILFGVGFLQLFSAF